MWELVTSRDQADGAEEPALRVVHLQRQQLSGESENLICERPESGVVDLSAGQGQAVGEGHGVLVGGVASANPQDLDNARRTKEKRKTVETRVNSWGFYSY